jgi:hypothetical protein
MRADGIVADRRPGVDHRYCGAVHARASNRRLVAEAR